MTEDASQVDATPRWFSTALTVVGHVRRVNEDAFLDAREQSLWVVADGMGGHSRGDRASQEIIQRLRDFKREPTPKQAVDEIVARLGRANDYCREAANGEVMGSTVAALYLHADSACMVWCGDSRIYRLRDNTLEQLTEDHSLVQELHRLGELSAEEAENHPSANVITRAIGVADELDVQIREVELIAGDRFLVCSDGLFKDVAFAEVQTNLSLPSPSQALDALVELALRRGGTDNVTAIVVQSPVAFSSEE
jgi:serine/threonine protein phosphatase PrpC